MESVFLRDIVSSSSDMDYLTEYDRRSRSCGYNQYLPDRADSFAQYWKSLYGIDWKVGDALALIGRLAAERDTVEDHPTERQLVGERLVPIQAVCRYDYSSDILPVIHNTIDIEGPVRCIARPSNIVQI